MREITPEELAAAGYAPPTGRRRTSAQEMAEAGYVPRASQGERKYSGPGTVTGRAARMASQALPVDTGSRELTDDQLAAAGYGPRRARPGKAQARDAGSRALLDAAEQAFRDSTRPVPAHVPEDLISGTTKDLLGESVKP